MVLYSTAKQQKQDPEGKVVLEVRNLKTALFSRKKKAFAVDGVSFTLHEGETLGIVGESGSGKTMTARSLMVLPPEPAAKIVGGEILLDGEDVLQMSSSELRRIRGRKIAIILQDPQTSLNPVYTVGSQIAEIIRPRPGEQLTKAGCARSHYQHPHQDGGCGAGTPGLQLSAPTQWGHEAAGRRWYRHRE